MTREINLYDKKKVDKTMETELGTIDPRQIENQITYPGQAEFNLRNVSYTPGENNYLRSYGEEYTNETS